MSPLYWHLKYYLYGSKKYVLAGSILIIFSGAFTIKNLALNKTIQTTINKRELIKGNLSSRTFNQKIGLGQFSDYVPNFQLMADQQLSIHKIAEKNGIQINQANFSLTKIPESHLVAYKMSFLINADYKKMRQFLSDFLLNFPNGSLDRIEFSRDNIETNYIDTHLTITLFYNELA